MSPALCASNTAGVLPGTGRNVGSLAVKVATCRPAHASRSTHGTHRERRMSRRLRDRGARERASVHGDRDPTICVTEQDTLTSGSQPGRMLGMSWSKSVFSVLVVAACGGSVRTVFHPTDASFRPTPGSAPPVYLMVNRHDLPAVGMRSVGRIEVTVPSSSGIQGAIEAAEREGARLGCWILVEHAVFEAREPSARLEHGGAAFLAHGGGGRHSEPERHGAGPSQDGSQVHEFHCVLKVERGGTARSSTRLDAPDHSGAAFRRSVAGPTRT